MEKSPFMRIVEDETNKKTEEEVLIGKIPSDGMVIPDKLRNAVGGEFGLRPIKYEKKTKGKLSISYAVDDDNYIYQVELDEAPIYPEDQVVSAIIQACSTVVPAQIDTFIGLPPKDLDWWVYTVIVKGIARQPGAKDFMENRLVGKMLELDFWH